MFKTPSIKNSLDFGQIRFDLYGTAQSQYNKTVPVPKPGNFVFFKLISLELNMLGYMSGMENLLMQMAVMERPILQLKSGKAYIPS
jgi:hypothetical protein